MLVHQESDYQQSNLPVSMERKLLRCTCMCDIHIIIRKTVTTTASTEEKLEFLRSLPYGATHTANYKTQDFSEEVKKTTEGKGVDVIIDFVGKSHWQKNIDSLAIDGRMTMLALLSGKSLDLKLGATGSIRLRLSALIIK
jgi:NADPH:quinone reductase-like Zn-dependent oxidoreductase